MQEERTAARSTEFSAATIIVTIQDVLRGWYLIAAAALIAAMLTFVYATATYIPQYRTTTTFVVTAAGTSTTTYQNLSATTNLAATFTEVLNSSLLRKVILEQGTVGSFSGSISAAAVPETNLLTMTVSGSDPRTVFLMAQAIIENHHLVSETVLGSTVLEVLQTPAVPTAPVNPPQTSRLVSRMAMLGAIGVAGLLGLLSLSSNRVRSKEEADSKLSCRILGELRHERKRRSQRRKSSILITNPLTSFVYTEAMSKLSSRVEKRRRKGEKIIMVTSLLENEGKSTVAVNLALALARKGRRVLLVDCDLRKPACRLILNMGRTANGVAEVLTGQAEIASVMQTVPGTTLDVLAGRRSMRTAVSLIASPAMREFLAHMATGYDLVIVDTPPMSLAPDAECIASMADACLLVVRQNDADADALNDAIGALEKTRVHLLGCVLNNVYGGASFAPAVHYGSYGRYGYGRYSYGRYGRYGYGRYGYGQYARKTDDSAAPAAAERSDAQ